MVPSWLSYCLERLPGRPIQQIKALIALVLIMAVVITIFSGNWTLIVGAVIFMFVSRLSRSIEDKELVDLRDWVVIRAISCTFWMLVCIWFLSTLVNGIKSIIDVIFLIVTPIALYVYMGILNNVLNLANQLTDWRNPKLIKRRDYEPE